MSHWHRSPRFFGKNTALRFIADRCDDAEWPMLPNHLLHSILVEDLRRQVAGGEVSDRCARAADLLESLRQRLALFLGQEAREFVRLCDHAMESASAHPDD